MPRIEFFSSICERVDSSYKNRGVAASRLVESTMRSEFGSLNFGDVELIELVEWVPAEDNPITQPQFSRNHRHKRIVAFVPMDIEKVRGGDADPNYGPYLLEQFRVALQQLHAEQSLRLWAGKKR